MKKMEFTTTIFGFTLIELLMVLMLISILSAITYPLYNEHLVKARRSYAMVALMDVMEQLEEHYAIYHTYTGMEKSHIHQKNCEKYYHLAIKAKNDTYTIFATPLGKQAKSDVFCGILSVDQNGNRYIGGSGTVAECWR